MPSSSHLRCSSSLSDDTSEFLSDVEYAAKKILRQHTRKQMGLTKKPSLSSIISRSPLKQQQQQQTLLSSSSSSSSIKTTVASPKKLSSSSSLVFPRVVSSSSSSTTNSTSIMTMTRRIGSGNIDNPSWSPSKKDKIRRISSSSLSSLVMKNNDDKNNTTTTPLLPTLSGREQQRSKTMSTTTTKIPPSVHISPPPPINMRGIISLWERYRRETTTTTITNDNNNNVVVVVNNNHHFLVSFLNILISNENNRNDVQNQKTLSNYIIFEELKEGEMAAAMIPVVSRDNKKKRRLRRRRRWEWEGEESSMMSSVVLCRFSNNVRRDDDDDDDVERRGEERREFSRNDVVVTIASSSSGRFCYNSRPLLHVEVIMSHETVSSWTNSSTNDDLLVSVWRRRDERRNETKDVTFAVELYDQTNGQAAEIILSGGDVIDNHNEEEEEEEEESVVYWEPPVIRRGETSLNLARAILEKVKTMVVEENGGLSSSLTWMRYDELSIETKWMRQVTTTVDDNIPPLSMRIAASGLIDSPYLCPGCAVTPRSSSSSNDNDIITGVSLFVTPVREDRISGTMFVLTVLAIETIHQAPIVNCDEVSLFIPPSSLPSDDGDTHIPQIHSHPHHLLSHAVRTELDSRRPPTILILDPMAEELDWALSSSLSSMIHHRRDWDTMNRFFFRVKCHASHCVDLDPTIPPRIYGVTERGAQHNGNTPTIDSDNPRILTSCDAITPTITLGNYRRQTSDYKPIVVHPHVDDHGGYASEATFFTCLLNSYNVHRVARTRWSSFVADREEERRVKLEMRRRETLRRKMARADDIIEGREMLLRRRHQCSSERRGRVDEGNHSFNDDNDNDDVPSSPPLTPRVAEETHHHNDDDDTLPEHDILFDRYIDRQIQSGTTTLTPRTNATTNYPQNYSDMALRQKITSSSHIDSSDNSSSSCSAIRHHINRIPPLNLSQTRTPPPPDSLEYHVNVRGYGWRTLPRAIIGKDFFKLNKHKIQKSSSSTTSSPLNNNDDSAGTSSYSNDNVLRKSKVLDIVNPKQNISYNIEEHNSFQTPVESFVIKDVMKDLDRLQALEKIQQKRDDAIANCTDSDALERILATQQPGQFFTPVELIDQALSISGGNGDLDNSYDDTSALSVDYQPHTVNNNNNNDDANDDSLRAIVAVKNSNFATLEEILENSNGIIIPVDTRDDHGNTLLILAAQQGHKKMIKFLLRRGASINDQNLAGNTALHYCYAYGHEELAKYLMRKGGDDSLLNADGLTCYEGVDREAIDLL